jgi:hypothetical protein
MLMAKSIDQKKICGYLTCHRGVHDKSLFRRLNSLIIHFRMILQSGRKVATTSPNVLPTSWGKGSRIIGAIHWIKTDCQKLSKAHSRGTSTGILQWPSSIPCQMSSVVAFDTMWCFGPDVINNFVSFVLVPNMRGFLASLPEAISVVL